MLYFCKKLMEKSKVFTVVAITALLSSSIFNACSKEENSLSNDNNSSIQKQQKWNSIKNASVILPDYMQPFQYAVHQDHYSELLDYTQIVLKNYKQEGEKGYCILSSHNNTADNLIYYGFITETSSYYDPKIFIDNPDNPFIDIDSGDDGMPMYANKITTKNKNRFDRWVKRKVERGYTVSYWYEDGYWNGEAKKN